MVKAQPVKKAPAKAAKTNPVKAAPAKAAPTKSAATKPAARVPAKPAMTRKKVGGRKVPVDKHLAKMQGLLLTARDEKVAEVDELLAEADLLATEAEQGDTQFDDESGEGGTTAIDRERDLALAAAQRAEIADIDVALDKIDAGGYGICERCGKAIPRARLEAVPWATQCVGCKSGGLLARR